MGWIVAIIVGAIIGWLASSVMGEREGLVGKIIIGIVGSLLAKWPFADLLHIGGGGFRRNIHYRWFDLGSNRGGHPDLGT